MKKFQERNPSNARIFINHKKKEVKFSYPNKRSEFSIVLSTLVHIWFFLTFFLGLIILIEYILIYNYYNPSHLTTKIVTNQYTLINFAGINFEPSSFKFLYLFFIWFFVPPIIATCIFFDNKNLLSIMPKINMALSLFPFGRYYYKEISSLNKKIFEIPLFSNVFLDYEPSGEFEDYLEEVKIIEHNIDYCRASIFSKKIKKTKNEYEWKARFIFSEIPKQGYLKIKFK